MRLTRQTTGLLPTLLAVAVAFACAADGTDEAARTNAREGSALGEIVPSAFDTGRRGLVPGQEAAFMFVTLANASAERIVLRSIEPLVEGSASAATVESIEVAPPEPDPNRAAPFMLYRTYPPAFDLREPFRRGASRACAVLDDLRSVAGYELEPARDADDFHTIVMRVRGQTEGVMRVRAHRVFYAQRGIEYYEDVPFELVVRVAEGRPKPPSDRERNCLHRTSALPTGA